MIKINTNKRRKNPQRIGVFLVIIAVFMGGFLWGRTSKGPEFFITDGNQQTFDLKADINIFWDVLKTIKSQYKDRNKISDEDLIFGAARGAVESLGDPYSQFFTPQESKKFLEDISGSFEGIGAEIGIKDKVLTIVAPLEGTPAKRAGLMSGDRIIKIDDEATIDMNLEEAIGLIRGPRGSSVVLTILRGQEDEEQEIVVKRDTIKVPIIEWSLRGNNDIAYVEFYSFTENSAEQFSRIAQEIINSSAKKIILDLRANPGGYLDASVEVAGWFIEKGDVVVKEDRGEKDMKEYISQGSAVFQDWPVIVLIDEGSASASEILAGALRDNLGIKLIGKQSFGKGSVQQMEEFSGGSSLKITIADWITPSGISITEEGLTPDLSIDLDIDAFKNGEDSQLNEAIKFLEKL